MPKPARKSGTRKLGKLVFVLPIIVVLSLFVLGAVSNAINRTGTLVVEAQSSYGGTSSPLSVAASVSGTTSDTPYNVTLGQGSYTVTYPPLQWYRTPPTNTVVVLGSKTAFSIGTYVPIAAVVGVSSGNFNSSRVTAEHGVTPVVWIDASAEAIQIKGNSFTAVIEPTQNYTGIFEVAGEVTVSLLGTSSTMVVDVT